MINNMNINKYQSESQYIRRTIDKKKFLESKLIFETGKYIAAKLLNNKNLRNFRVPPIMQIRSKI